MKIKVYVDWNNKEILSEKDYKEFKNRKVNEMADTYFEDKYSLEEFLSDNYNYADIFNMTNEEKEEAKAKWKAQCKDNAEENFGDEYDYDKIELEV